MITSRMVLPIAVDVALLVHPNPGRRPRDRKPNGPPPPTPDPNHTDADTASDPPAASIRRSRSNLRRPKPANAPRPPAA